MSRLFADLIAAPELQEILDSFYAASGISAAVLEWDGQSHAASSGLTPGDKFLQRLFDPSSCVWQGDDETLSRMNIHSSGQHELLAGLIRYALPIQVEGREIAILSVGPLFIVPPDEQWFARSAHAQGLDQTGYLQAVRALPVVPGNQAHAQLAFLAQIVRRLAENGLNRLQLAESLTAAHAHMDQLKRAYLELEARIQERTAELEKTNTAYQESEQRFRVALVDTPVVVFNQDLNLRYTWIYNAQNYADQSVVGKTDEELFAPDDALRLTTLKRRVMAAGLLTREEVSMTVGGKTNFYDMTLDPLYDLNGAVVGLTCAATNITERKQLAVLEERERLARDLHDSVTQALYSLTLHADAARLAYSAQQWESLQRNLYEVRQMARQAMYDMRLLIFELRPLMLEIEGLAAALRARLAAVEGRAGLKTDVVVTGERRLPIAIEEDLYRIVQEGLNNVVRHAGAREVKIRLAYTPDAVCLEMQDDGAGFDRQLTSGSGGVGLRGMQERARHWGGSLEIESAPGKGTHLTVKIPAGESV